MVDNRPPIHKYIAKEVKCFLGFPSSKRKYYNIITINSYTPNLPDSYISGSTFISAYTKTSVKRRVAIFSIAYLTSSISLMLSLSAADAPVSKIQDECQVTPVIHVLQYPGCVPKPIPSYACNGRCGSYVQVSGSKIWQMERSCMCCQESGEREASVHLFCPKAKAGERKFRTVTTKAPLECMCRPCTTVEESAVIPQELAGYEDSSPLNNHFSKSE